MTSKQILTQLETDVNQLQTELESFSKNPSADRTIVICTRAINIEILATRLQKAVIKESISE